MTTFDDLMPLIRAAIGDTDSSHYLYKTNNLYNFIRLNLVKEGLEESNPVTSPPSFNSTLDMQQKTLIVLSTAIMIISGWPKVLDYKNPVMQVKRQRDDMQIQELKKTYILITNGSFVISDDNEMNKLINYRDRFDDQLVEAYSAG